MAISSDLSGVSRPHGGVLAVTAGPAASARSTGRRGRPEGLVGRSVGRRRGPPRRATTRAVGGQVDGHSFCFRERGGDWNIELDLCEQQPGITRETPPPPAQSPPPEMGRAPGAGGVHRYHPPQPSARHADRRGRRRAGLSRPGRVVAGGERIRGPGRPRTRRCAASSRSSIRSWPMTRTPVIRDPDNRGERRRHRIAGTVGVPHAHAWLRDPRPAARCAGRAAGDRAAVPPARQQR